MIAHCITSIALEYYEVPPLLTARYNDLGTQNGRAKTQCSQFFLNRTPTMIRASRVLSCRWYKQSWVVSERSTPEHCGPPLGNTAEVISLLCTITGTGGDKRIRPTAWISTYEDNAARLTCLYVCQVNAHSYSLHLSKSILMDTHTHTRMYAGGLTQAPLSPSAWLLHQILATSLERCIIT